MIVIQSLFAKLTVKGLVGGLGSLRIKLALHSIPQLHILHTCVLPAIYPSTHLPIYPSPATIHASTPPWLSWQNKNIQCIQDEYISKYRPGCEEWSGEFQITGWKWWMFPRKDNVSFILKDNFEQRSFCRQREEKMFHLTWQVINCKSSSLGRQIFAEN